MKTGRGGLGEGGYKKYMRGILNILYLLSCQFSTCMQDDVTVQHLCLASGQKNIDLYYLPISIK